jgi:hypothetical protein
VLRRQNWDFRYELLFRRIRYRFLDVVPKKATNRVYTKDAILKLILDLATYEKEPESAKATPDLVWD